jgi:hypothetical protein
MTQTPPTVGRVRLRLSVCNFELRLHSGMSEIEGRLPCSRLVVLCRNEAVLKWMSSCDHLMYQALVEILIPDVLRPIPSEWLTHTVTHTLSHSFLVGYQNSNGDLYIDCCPLYLSLSRCLDSSHPQLCQKPGRLAQQCHERHSTENDPDKGTDTLSSLTHSHTHTHIGK